MKKIIFVLFLFACLYTNINAINHINTIEDLHEGITRSISFAQEEQNKSLQNIINITQIILAQIHNREQSFLLNFYNKKYFFEDNESIYAFKTFSELFEQKFSNNEYLTFAKMLERSLVVISNRDLLIIDLPTFALYSFEDFQTLYDWEEENKNNIKTKIWDKRHIIYEQTNEFIELPYNTNQGDSNAG